MYGSSEGAASPVVFDRPFGTAIGAPSAAVVIVVWQLDDGLERCLAALRNSQPGDWELIVVGNGVDPARSDWGRQSAGLAGTVIGLPENLGPSPARNAAAARTTAPILLFLDDDAIPEAGWVQAHLAAHDDPSIKAVRGRVIAHQHPFLTRLARAYDLGDRRRSAVLNTEGNASIDREAFMAVGGFGPLFGHEGVELSARLMERFGVDSVLYDPVPVIRHDYVSSFSGYLKKRFRHGGMMRRLGPAQVRMAASVRPRWRPRDLLMSPLRLVGGAAELLGLLWPNRANHP